MARPGATVVVPTARRPEALARCLEAVARQEPVPGGFDMVVVADGPPGAAARVVNAACRGGLDVRLVEQAAAGPAAARNRGAGAASGGVLAFTDDDCCPDSGWLRGLFSALETEPRAVVGGPVINALSSNPYAEAAQLVVDVVVDYLKSADSSLSFFTSNNIALRRTTLQALEGFDTRFPRAAAEDRDLCERARVLGYPLVFAADAQVEHAHDLTLARLCRQQFRYGQGAVALNRSRRARGSGPWKAETGLYKALARAAWHGKGRARRVSLVALTQATCGLGVAAELSRRP